MQATIYGVPFLSANCYVPITGSIVVIEGFSGTSSTSTSYPRISLAIQGYTKTTGTFPINQSGTGVTAAYYTSSTNNVNGISGSVTITSASTTSIVGTFNFICTDSTKVEGGSFTSKGY